MGHLLFKKSLTFFTIISIMEFVDMIKDYGFALMGFIDETDETVLSLVGSGQLDTALDWLSGKLLEEREPLKRFYLETAKTSLEHMLFGVFDVDDEPLWEKYYRLFAGKEPVFTNDERLANLYEPVNSVIGHISKSGVFNCYYKILSDLQLASEREVFFPVVPPRVLSEEEQNEFLMSLDLSEFGLYVFERWGLFEASGLFWDVIRLAKKFEDLDEPVIVYPLYKYLQLIVEKVSIARRFLRRYLYFVRKSQTPFSNALEIALQKVLGEPPTTKPLSYTALKIAQE